MMSRPDLYYERISSIPGPISEVFEQYSGIAKSEQVDHVISVRDRAYTTHQYPCLGRFRFLELELSRHHLYRSYVVPTLTRATGKEEVPPIFLDLGTCLGQDLRKLVFDGVPPSRLYGSDIEQTFIDTGYEMFLDEGKMPRDRFLCPADVFDDPAKSKFSTLTARVDILNASAVFHLFDEAKQIDVARCCMRLLRKDPGSTSLVLGAHVGSAKARETLRHSGGKFRHDENTWEALWKQVCQEQEFCDRVKDLKVKSSTKQENWTPTDSQALKEGKDGANIEEGFRWMRFEVWISF